MRKHFALWVAFVLVHSFGVGGFFLSILAWVSVGNTSESILELRVLVTGSGKAQAPSETQHLDTQLANVLLPDLMDSWQKYSLAFAVLFGVLIVLCFAIHYEVHKHLRSNQPLHPDALTRAGERRR